MDPLAYWDREDVESMYDKHLLGAELALIAPRIPTGSLVLDAGCGEGEGTARYREIAGARLHAVDFSPTRLRKAAARLAGAANVELERLDLTRAPLSRSYDVIVSQRFLINLAGWPQQQEVLAKLLSALRPGGRLLLLEGSRQGVERLDALRARWGLPPIPIKWHNRFLDDEELRRFLDGRARLVEEAGLGAYFVLTRCLRPALEPGELRWDCDFNRRAAESRSLGISDEFSRLKLWLADKP